MRKVILIVALAAALAACSDTPTAPQPPLPPPPPPPASLVAYFYVSPTEISSGQSATLRFKAGPARYFQILAGTSEIFLYRLNDYNDAETLSLAIGPVSPAQTTVYKLTVRAISYSEPETATCTLTVK